MLSNKIDDLVAEVRAARIQAKRYWGPIQYLEDRYRGGEFGQENGPTEPEAVVHQYVSLTLPSVAFDLPKVQVDTQRKGTLRATAEGIGKGLERWMVDTGFRRVEAALCLDMLFVYGVGVVTQEPAYGAEGLVDVPYRPQVRRLDRRRYFHDSIAESEAEVRFRGHACVYDKEDLVRLAETDKDGGWNLEVIKSLAVTDDLTEVRPRKRKDDTQRKEVVIFEVWVPEHEIEGKSRKDGFNGVIYTLACGRDQTGKQVQDFVRSPRAYYGPRWGPYVLFGAYSVPGHSYPSGPLAMCQGQIRAYTDFAKVVLAAASNYKRLLIINRGADPKLAQVIKDGKHDYVFDGVNVKSGDIEVFEVGGATQQMYDQLALLRENMDRSLAMADVTRGTVTGEGTATENQLAFSSSSARMSWVKSQFAEGVNQVLRTVAWFMFYDDRVVFPMAGPLDGEGQQRDAMFFGGNAALRSNRPKIRSRMQQYGVDPGEDYEKEGVTDEFQAGSFDDLELRVNIYSMERPGEAVQQRRITELLNLLGVTVPMQATAPWIKWDEVYKLAGEAVSFADLARVINLELLSEMSGFQVDQQLLAVQAARLALDNPQAGEPKKQQAPPQLPQPTSGNGKAANSPAAPSRGGSSLGPSSGNKASQSSGVSFGDQRR